MGSELDERDVLVQPAAAGPREVRDAAAADGPVVRLQERPHDLGEDKVLPVLHGAGGHVGVEQPLQPTGLSASPACCRACNVRRLSRVMD